MQDERILKKLFDYIVSTANRPVSHLIDVFSFQSHKEVQLQEGAMFAIKNLVDKNDTDTPQRLSQLKEKGLVEKLECYLSTSKESSRSIEE